jgi:hypothetical protein
VKGKELVIAVAEKLGKPISEGDFNLAALAKDNGESQIQEYLHDKAAEILFSEGMAGKIRKHLFVGYQSNPELSDDHTGQSEEFESWFDELSPEKILNVWLEVKGE